MMPRALCSIIILFSSLLTESESAESNLCSVAECNGSPKFHVDKLTSLIYEYNSEIVTDIQGINNDKAENLSLTAKVHLQLHSPCEFNMQLFSVKVSGIHSQSNFAAMLEQNPIRFHLSGNGTVVGVCPFHEPPEIVNIKKGIISLLQSTATDERRKQTINDMDVLGECPTEYIQRRGWNSWIIKKEKDLSLCNHHHHLESSIQLNPLTRGLRSLPLVRGNQSCRQILSAGFVTEVECNERHVFRPFSTDDGGGAVTRISQKLRLLNQDAFHQNNPINFGEVHERSNLLAQYSKKFRPKNSEDRRSVDEILGDICKEALMEEGGITPWTLTLFGDLSRALYSLSTQELLNVVEKSSRYCYKGNKIILDVISQLDTTASMSFMSKYLVTGSLPRSTMDNWINFLSFQREITIDKIEAVLPLFNSSINYSAFLAASVMVYTYCQSHVPCKDDKLINSIALLLEEHLARDCQEELTDREHRVLLALKAIGNIGQFDQIIPKLEKCSINDNVPTSLRLAAVQAHRRFSCQISRQHLIDLFTNRKTSSELRIAAYLEIMRCPTFALIQIIENALEIEEINQVGSFVWTHLTNIQESSDLCKSQLQSLLANVHLQSKFSTDARKFSRAFESSVFSETLDAGVHSEAHIIFPTDSYVPRSMLLNLTVDVFGRSINFLEVSGRATGFESLVQSIFGPAVAPPTYTQPTKEKNSINEQKLKNITNIQLLQSGFGHEPHALASVKFFGNEVHVWSARGKELLPFFGHASNVHHFFSKLHNDHHVDFSQISNILDTHLTLATGTGVPLTLSLQSTAGINFYLSGRADIRRLIASRTCYVSGRIRSSVTLKLTGTMAVDLLNNPAGVQLDSTLHSSNVVDGLLEMRTRELVRLQINMPRDKIEVLNVQSKLLVIQGQKIKPIDGIQRDRTHYDYCSSKLTSNSLGFQICGSLAYPNASRMSSAPYFPLTGPTEARIFLEKTDPGLTNFLIEYKWEKDETVQATDPQMLRYFLLSFNTPRSSTDRELTADFFLNREDREVTFRLITPFKKIAFSGKYIDQPDHRKLDAILEVDNEKFLVQTDLRSETTETTYRLLPNLHIRSPTQPLLSMSGSLTLLIGSKLNIDIRLDHLTLHPIIFSGHVVKSERHPNRIDWDLQLDARPLFTDIKGFYQTDNEATSATCTFGYTWRDGDKQLIEFLTKIRKVSLPNRSLTRIGSTTELRLTAFPEYNTIVTWNFLNAQGHVENIVQLGFGVNARNEYHQIGLRQIFSYSGSIVDKNLSNILKIVYPAKEIDFGVSVNYNGRDDVSITHIVVQMKPDQRIKLSTNFTDHTKSLANLLGEIILELPSRTINIRGRLLEEIRHQYVMTTDVSWDVDKEVTIIAVYRNKSHRKQLFYTFRANVTVLDRNPWEWNYAFLARENHMHFSTEFVLSEAVRYAFLSNLTRPQRGKYNVHGLIVWVDTDYSLDSNLTLGDEKLLETDVRLGDDRLIRTSLASKIYDDLTTVDFELLWDARRNISQRIGLNVEHRRLGLGQSKGSLNLQYPGSQIEATIAKDEKGSYFFPLPFSYVVKGEVTWNRIRQFGVNLDANRVIHGYRQEERILINLFTILVGFEKVEGEFYRVSDGVEWQATTKCVFASWLQAEGMMRTTDILSSQRTDVNLRWRTFVIDWDEVNLNGWWVTSASQIKGQIISEWGGDRRLATFLELSDVSHDFTRIFGIFNISTPWPELQLMGLGFHYVLSDAILDVRGTCRWHLNPTMAVHLTSKNNRKGEYQITVLVNSPVPDFEEILLQSNYALHQNSFSTNATLKWNDDQKMYVEVHARKHSSGRSKAIRAGVKLTTPFSMLDSIGTEFHYTKERNALSLFHVMFWPLDNVIRVTVDARRNNLVGILGNFTLTTPWVGYNNIGAFLQHKRTNDQMKSMINLVKDEKIVTGRVFTNVQHHRVQREIELQTPIEFLKQLFLSASSDSKINTFTTNRGLFRYNFGETEGDYVLDVDDIFNWRGALNLSARNQQLRLATTQNYQRGDLRHSSNINWATDKAIDVSVTFLNDIGVNRKIEGSINISTPFLQYENSNARLMYSTAANNGSVFLSGNLMTTNFDLKAWKTNDVLGESLKIAFSVGDHLRLRLNGICNDADARMCDGLISGKWNENENDRLVISGNFSANPNKPSFRLRLQTPTNAIKTVSLLGSYDKLNNIFLIAYDRNDEIFLNFNSTWLDIISFDGSFQRDAERWSTSGQVDVFSQRKTFGVDLAWPENKEIHCHLLKDGQNLFNASVNLISVFRTSPLRGEIFLKRETEKVHLKTFAQWHRHKIVRLVSNYDELNEDYLLEVDARVEDRQHFGSKFQLLRHSDDRYSCSASFTANDKLFRIDASLLNRSDLVDFSVDIRTPLEEYKDIKFNWLWNNVDCRTHLLIADSKVPLFNGTARIVNDPHKQLFIELTADAIFRLMILRENDRQTTIDLQLGGLPHVFRGNLAQDGDRFTGLLQETSSTSDFHQLRVTIKQFHATGQDIQLVTYNQQHKVNLQFNHDGYHSGHAYLDISSPLLSFRQVSSNLTFYTDENDSKLGTLTLILPQKVDTKIDVNVTFRHFSNWSVTVNGRGPFIAMSSFETHAHYAKNYDRFIDFGIDLRTDIPQFERAGMEMRLNKIPGQKLDALIRFHTPFENFDVASADGTVFYDKDLNNIHPLFSFILSETKFNVSGGIQFRADRIVSQVEIKTELWEKIQISSVVVTDPYNAAIDVNFLSPWTSYEKIQFNGSYRLGNENKCRLELSLPQGTWRANVVGNWDQFPDRLNIDGQIEIPSSTFQTVTLLIREEMTVDSFDAKILSTWSDDETVELSMDFVSRDDIKTGKIVVKDPFDIIPRVEGFYFYSDVEDSLDARASFNFNDDQLLDFQIFTNETHGVDARRALRLVNPIWPFRVSFNTTNPTAESFRVLADFATNPNSKDVFPYFADLLYRSRTSEKSLVLKTTHQQRVTVFNTSYDKTNSFCDYQTHITWNSDGRNQNIFGYGLSITNKSQSDKTNYEGSLTLSHPIRSIKIIGDVMHARRHVKSAVKFHWDFSRNQEKVVAFRLDGSSRQGTMYEGEFGLTYPSFEKEVVLRGNFTGSKGGTTLTSAHFVADYSSDPDDLFTAFVEVRNGSGRNRAYVAEAGIKHIVSEIDVHFLADGSHDDDRAEINCGFSYLGEFRDRYFRRLRGQIDKKQNIVRLEFENRGKTVEMIGKISENQTHRSINLARLDNNQKIDLVELLIDKESGKSDIKFMYSNQSYYRLRGGLRSNTEFVLEAFRDEPRDHDIFTLLELSNPYFFTYELIWKTTILSRLKEYTFLLTRYYVTKIQNDWDRIKNFLDDEIQSKLENTGKNIRNFARPILTQIQTDVDLLKADLNSVGEKLKSFYRNNDFYLKDILALIDGVSQELMKIYADIAANVHSSLDHFWLELDRLIDHFYEVWWSWREALTDALEDMTFTVVPFVGRSLDILENQLSAWKLQLSNGISTMIRAIQNTLVATVQQSSQFGEVMKSKFASLWNAIRSLGEKISTMWSETKNFFLDQWLYVKTSFLQSELYLNLRDGVSEILSFIDRLWRLEIYRVIKTRLDAVRRVISNHSLIAFIHRQITWVCDKVNWFAQQIIYHSEVQLFKSAILETHRKIQWILDYYRLRDGIFTSIWRLHRSYDSLVQRRGYQRGVQFDTRNRVMFAPNEGRIRVDQYLPVPWFALTQLPRFNQLKELQTLAQLRSWFSGPRTSVWEKYYKYRPYLSPKTWFPPFSSYAIIAGNNHYFTFDGRHYEFSGHCVYLLAHDSVDGNLTLAVNYASKATPSLLLLVEGKEIEISSKVTINGKKAELPQMIGKTSINRQGCVVSIIPARGTLIRCNLEYRVCSLWTDGWYFGKIAGLFGTQNNEPSDDVQESTDQTSFDKWEVGNDVCKNYAQPSFPALLPDDDCVSFFEDEFSFFKYCFSHVDPKPYHQACLSNQYERLGTCAVAAAYVMACNLKDIPLAMPRECVRCSTFDGEMVFEGDNVTVKAGDVSPSSDVVFIIEARKCNQQSITKLPDLLKSIEEALVYNNLTGNRYSLVAFGGDDVFDRAHVRTVDNEIFANERVVISSFNNIQLGNGTEDVFGALQFASNLPFRIGASKTFIVLVCAPCRQTSREMDYPEVHRMLLEDRIHIHLLMDHEFNIKGSRDFYGIDAMHAFTVKDSRRKILTGDKELRALISAPKYICVPLALESNGTVFSSRALTDGRKRTKNFLDVFSRRVALTASEVIDCLSCDCFADNEGSGKMHCQPCHLPGSWYADLHSFLYDDSEEWEELDNSKQKTKIE